MQRRRGAFLSTIRRTGPRADALRHGYKPPFVGPLWLAARLRLAGPLWLAGVLALTSPLDASRAEAFQLIESLTPDGYVEEGFAYGVAERSETLYHRQTVNLKLADRINRRYSFRFEGEAFRDDPDFRAEPDSRVRIREAHFKARFERFDVRAGRILLAWGEADGVIVSDQISSFDFTNFIVPPFDSIRQGVDGATVDYYFDNGSELQAVWLAGFRPHVLAGPDSPWSLFQVGPDLLPPGVDPNLLVGPTNRPARTFRNSGGGLRYTAHPQWGDWSIGYLHSIDDTPAVRVPSPANLPPGQMPQFSPTYRPFDLLALNIAAPVQDAPLFGDVLLRVDSAFEKGRLLSTAPDFRRLPGNPCLRPGCTVRQDVWHTLVGLDWKPRVDWWQQADASVQYIHNRVLSPEPGLIRANRTDHLSVLLRAAYLNDTVKPWLFMMYNLAGDDVWVQTKVDYEPVDRWRLSLEYDVFAGKAYDPISDSGGQFGSFDANDMVQGSIRYSF